MQSPRPDQMRELISREQQQDLETARAAAQAAYFEAMNADAVFEAAVQRAGYATRWDWPGAHYVPASDPVAKAFYSKIAADDRYHDACLALRAIGG